MILGSRDGRWRSGLAAAEGFAGLSAGVAELDADLSPLPMDRLAESPHFCGIGIIVQSHVPGNGLPAGLT